MINSKWEAKEDERKGGERERFVFSRTRVRDVQAIERCVV